MSFCSAGSTGSPSGATILLKFVGVCLMGDKTCSWSSSRSPLNTSSDTLCNWMLKVVSSVIELLVWVTECISIDAGMAYESAFPASS